MNSEQLEETTMSKKNRRMKQITINDERETQIMFSKLMGSAVPPRREFIEKNAHKANVEV